MGKLGLVLEGGGMRGAYTAGVLAWFLRNNIEMDHVSGVSSGAMYGAFFLAKDEELLRKASIEIAPSKDNVGIRPLLKERQIVGYDHMYDVALIEAGYKPENILRSESEFSVAVYDMEIMDTIWMDKQTVAKDVKWIKAACSLPFYSRLVNINGRDYTDGGVTTMIPLRHSLEVGCDRNIIVTTKSKEYVRKPFKKLTLWFLRTFFYRSKPKVVQDFSKRTDIYYEERQLVDQQVEQKRAIYLYPTKETGVSRFSGTRQQFEDLYQMGIDDCERQRDEIMELVNKR